MTSYHVTSHVTTVSCASLLSIKEKKENQKKRNIKSRKIDKRKRKMLLLNHIITKAITQVDKERTEMEVEN